MPDIEADAAHVEAVAEHLAGPRIVYVLASRSHLDVFDTELAAQKALEMAVLDCLNEQLSDCDEYAEAIKSTQERLASDPNTFAATWFGSGIVHPLPLRK